MSNPLFKELNNRQNVPQGVAQLKRMLNGDPRQYIASMLNSGQVTQAQIEQAKRMASMLNIKL